MRLLVLALLALFLFTSPAHADFTGKVVGVIDGDTIDVMHNGRSERIRLHGIDAPEKSQAFGRSSKRAASDRAFGQGCDRTRTRSRSVWPDTW